jgi:hypothetical protein
MYFPANTTREGERIETINNVNEKEIFHMFMNIPKNEITNQHTMVLPEKDDDSKFNQTKLNKQQ